MIKHLGRRGFVGASASSIAALALPACSALEPTRQAPSPSSDRAILDRPLVDIHAHIFAANDLQGYQFITQVRMASLNVGDKLSGRLKAFVAALADAIDSVPPNAADEADYFYKGKEPQTHELKEILQQTFVNLRDRKFKPPAEIACAQNPEEQNRQEEQIKTDGVNAYNALASAFLFWRIDDVPTLLAAKLAVLFKDDGTLSMLGRTLAGVLEARSAVVHVLLEFLRGFRESRFKRADLWASFVQGSGKVGDYPRFLVPALVDFSYSLKDGRDGPTVRFEQQVEIMALLSRQQAPNRIVHGHVPFNPWRFARGTDQEKRNSLELIRYAINDCGFLGVKMYPPMGFQAWGNDTIVPGQFNLLNEDNATCPVSNAFPFDLDAELTKLYDFCLAEDVPIMLHSGVTNEAKDNWGHRVDPQFWWPILEKRPKLRVNFAHFGGGGFKVNPNDIPTGPQYMKSIVVMMRKYPNVYADLGDYSLVLKGNDEQKDSFTKEIAKLRSTYGPDCLRDRLMFGTDWMFVAASPGSNEFPQRMLNYMVDEIGKGPSAERERITTNYAARNACRLLGFDDPRGKVLQRLNKFYAKHHLDRRTLDLFVDIAREGRATTVARA